MPIKLIRGWFHRHFSDPQVVILVVLLVAGALGIFVLGKMLAPVLASLVIAYLLEGLVGFLERLRIPRIVAVLLVFLAFFCFLLFLVLGLLPLLWQQVSQLLRELPSMISWTQKELLGLVDRYSTFIAQKEVLSLIELLRAELMKMGQQILSLSVASVRVLIWVLVYIFLMPLMVFFFLKDKNRLLAWISRFLPEEPSLAREVWADVDQQIGNYVRGKFWEILIVWGATYATFSILHLNYAVLLGLFVGLSVLIPYIGAVFMTLPVAAIAYFQWGWGNEFAYVVMAYVLIQILDGNVLVTLLFSEVVNLHPIAIIVSVLVFGGTFGFWGVFFAIPLATLVQAVIKAWPVRIPFSEEGTVSEGDPHAQEAQPGSSELSGQNP